MLWRVSCGGSRVISLGGGGERLASWLEPTGI
jgi:hypothetical protein